MEKEQAPPEHPRKVQPNRTSKLNQKPGLQSQKSKDSGDLSKDVKIQKGKTKEPPDLKNPSSDAKRVGARQLKEELTKASEAQVDNVEAQLSKSKKRRIRKKRLLESLGINVINPNNSSNTKKRKKKKKICAEKEDGSVVHETCRKSGISSDIISNCVTECWKDLKFDGLGQKGPAKKLESASHVSCCNKKVEVPKVKDVRAEVPKVKDTPKLKDIKPEVSKTQRVEPSKAKEKQPEVPKSKDTKSDVKRAKTELPRTKIGKTDAQRIQEASKKSASKLVELTEGNSCSKGCCEEVPIRNSDKEPSTAESKSSAETISRRKTKHKDEEPSGQVDLVNLLSHDNVEGLFRSALLNDVNLSSRCSEKEVKNFFNTYGTFSERGRTQFAAVEKLLNSSNNDTGVTSSHCLESSLDKEKSSSSICKSSDATTVDKVVTSTISGGLPILPKCDSVSTYIKKPDNPLGEPSEAKVPKGLCSGEAVLKGGFTRGPIYTSPNLENRVTNSVNSSQILTRTNRAFFADAYKLCKIDDQDITNSDQEKAKLKVLELSDWSSLTDTSNCPSLDCMQDSSVKNSANEKKIPLGQSYTTNTSLETNQSDDRVSTAAGPVVSETGSKDGNSVYTNGSNCDRRPEESKLSANVKEITKGSDCALTDSARESELRKGISDCVSKFREDSGKLGKTETSTSTDIVSNQSSKIEVPLKQEEISLEIETKIESRPISKDTAAKTSTDHHTTTNSNSVTSCESSTDISVPVLENNCTMKSSQVKKPEGANPPKTEKTREEIVAEREAKKAAKLAAKNKQKVVNAPAGSPKPQTASNKQSAGSVKEAEGPSDPVIAPTETTKAAKAVESVLPKEKVSEATKDNKQIPAGAGDVGKVEKAESAATAEKSKAELRAERRAKQEAQRAAKAVQQQIKTEQGKSAVQAKPSTPAKADVKEKLPKTDTEADVPKKPTKSIAHTIKSKAPEHKVIKDYETPPQKEFSRGLEAELQPSISFLDTCRPLSVSMTNALRFLKRQLTLLPNNVSDSEAKKKLLDIIDTYIREQIDMAAQAICIMVQKKIVKDDVILTYGCSSLVQRILVEAHANGKTKFKVVVVDGWPWREGREMLRRLVECGIDCSYVLVTKVLLGAHALLANGYVMSRAGSSQVALLARSYNVPVLVCCETHKFCERVQTDSFVYNELGNFTVYEGNPDDLIRSASALKETPVSNWKSIGSLTPLNLTYDVTPPDLVSAVVTELGILPCTSVPVVLRIKPSEIGS
ncbi:hypothetical protein C0J52_25272 [Blattella germanica]|nr:hypothetical protein C0J52_25272 [Blattella germanica]